MSNLYDFYNPQTCNDGTGVMTPYGWQWVNSVTAIDPTNSSNIFRGNVTTNYGTCRLTGAPSTLISYRLSHEQPNSTKVHRGSA